MPRRAPCSFSDAVSATGEKKEELGIDERAAASVLAACARAGRSPRRWSSHAAPAGSSVDVSRAIFSAHVSAPGGSCRATASCGEGDERRRASGGRVRWPLRGMGLASKDHQLQVGRLVYALGCCFCW
jgi:hypothetical protein